jgi:uroporphyrinogen decarboxylase
MNFMGTTKKPASSSKAQSASPTDAAAAAVLESPFLAALAGQPQATPPIWMMRQAGRFLPEYRATRAKAGSFLDLCYNPELAAEVTLQPIRRFGFDAAILFADILLVPDALGQKVTFKEKQGPILKPLSDASAIGRLSLSGVQTKYALVAETVSRVRAALSPQTALIGFCGAPWTVATYMVAGHATPDQAPARLWAYRDPEGFGALIDLLVEASVVYLNRQVEAGVQALQIFDSWCGVLAEDEFERWVIEPTARMVAALRSRHPDVPVIGFPRGSGPLCRAYVERTGVQGLGCDWTLPLSWIRDQLQPLATVQGNLDPLLLLAGGAAMDRRVGQIIDALSSGPFIFNLGHGIDKSTPVEHVERLVGLVRERK